MSSHVRSGSFAPHIDEPTDVMVTGVAPSVSIAESTHTLSIGKAPVTATAT